MSDMNAYSSRAAQFSRGYFLWLNRSNIKYAILHGGENAFEGKITDIDYVVDREEFKNIPFLVNEYCKQNDWRLCQVLRHEDTAAFCVCSHRENPNIVVALDACSDYQRNGLLLLRSEEMLNHRDQLAWGGYRLNTQLELRYRFIKAAAKGKDPHESTLPLVNMPESARAGFSNWIEDNWGLTIGSWDHGDAVNSLLLLTKRCKTKWRRIHPASYRRLLKRVILPDGLLLKTPAGNNQRVQQIREVFDGLYFRKSKSTKSMKAANRLDLIRSYLVFTDSIDSIFTVGLSDDCLLAPPPNLSEKDTMEFIANTLHKRCLRREALE